MSTCQSRAVLHRFSPIFPETLIEVSFSLALKNSFSRDGTGILPVACWHTLHCNLISESFDQFKLWTWWSPFIINRFHFYPYMYYLLYAVFRSYMTWLSPLLWITATLRLKYKVNFSNSASSRSVRHKTFQGPPPHDSVNGTSMNTARQYWNIHQVSLSPVPWTAVFLFPALSISNGTILLSLQAILAYSLTYLTWSKQIVCTLVIAGWLIRLLQQLKLAIQCITMSNVKYSFLAKSLAAPCTLTTQSTSIAYLYENYLSTVQSLLSFLLALSKICYIHEEEIFSQMLTSITLLPALCCAPQHQFKFFRYILSTGQRKQAYIVFGFIIKFIFFVLL